MTSDCIKCIIVEKIHFLNLFLVKLLIIISYYDFVCIFLLVCQNPDDVAQVLPSSDPTAHLLPNRIKDFTAFINLVDFCR